MSVVKIPQDQLQEFLNQKLQSSNTHSKGECPQIQTPILNKVATAKQHYEAKLKAEKTLAQSFFVSKMQEMRQKKADSLQREREHILAKEILAEILTVMNRSTDNQNATENSADIYDWNDDGENEIIDPEKEYPNEIVI